ncbi:MAG: tyrosine-type recombinase/integrase [Planctomycetota bacterium]
MPHHPQPFFRKSRGLWYVEINGKQYNLGRDQDEAFRRYHDLMRQPRDRPVPTDSVVAVVDAYLDWCQKHRAPDTYEWYRYRLQRFIDFIPRGLRVAQLKPHHVQRWVDSFEHLSLGSKRNYCRAIQRAMRWAEQQGYVDRSPIAHLQKPPQGKRNRVVSQEEFDGILAVVPMREARDLLTVAWETGARAQELLRVEARHVDLQGNRWVFSPEEEKMCRMPRVVYLTDQAMGMTRRLMLQHPQGPLFRNSRGVPWTTDAVNNLFCRIERKVGVKYCLTVFRHSWCTRALAKGVDSLTVAVLMGHADPSMVARVYSHLSHAPTYLLDQARKAAG